VGDGSKTNARGWRVGKRAKPALTPLRKTNSGEDDEGRGGWAGGRTYRHNKGAAVGDEMQDILFRTFDNACSNEIWGFPCPRYGDNYKTYAD
jgi:hypothetical protein